MHALVFYGGLAWLTLLLGVTVILVARRGSAPGRILALDLLVLVLIGLLGLYAGQTGRSYPLDAALALALLSFVATLAAARYAEDREPYG